MKKIKINQKDLCLLARSYNLAQADIVYDGENLQVTDNTKAAEIESLLTQDNWSAVAIAELKDDLKKQVDELAGKERQKYITDIAGQPLVYREKQNEAFAYSKNWFAHKNAPEEVPEPKENDYLMLRAGLGVEGKTMIDVASTVTQAYAEWQIIGAAIEEVRLKTKMAIEEAKTAEEAQAIFEAIEWPKNKKQDNTATKT